ncbi:DUF637 domain-containing protein [Pseudorhodoferax sp. Leaf267]|uniref:DUF637 domain-containing protein n=1 Tax=Pseudorhodoferax sp. Leaf267 TaxID=1736316 RepID=UPI0012E253B1|nr:DUF637 domain-containing protein [Pseudorhodoferax sp. Leaf267]
MAWVQQISQDPQLGAKVDWQQVQEAHSRWDYNRQGLTPVGAAVLTAVVAYFTAGAASTWASGVGEAAAVGVGEGVALSGGGAFLTGTGTTISTVVGGAVTAGVSALAGQAAVALVNNQGDLGKTLDELGSSGSVKGLLTAVVTGGVLSGLNLNPTGMPTAGGGAQGFMEQLGHNLKAGAARAVIGTAISGGSLQDNLRNSLQTAFLDTTAAQSAAAIGDIQNGFANKVAHALAGCAVGAARTDGGCGAGAIGAVMGELSAETFGFDEYGNPKAGTSELAAMLGAMGAAIAGLDASQISLAANAASNAAVNNALKHYVDRALSKLNDALKTQEIKPLVESQKIIRDYLESAGARGGLTETEIVALGILYAANEALFPTGVLDVLPGGKAVSKVGAGVKAGNKAEDVLTKIRNDANSSAKGSTSDAQNIANGPLLTQQLLHSEAASLFIDGALRPDVIAASKVAIPGSQLKNPDLIAKLTADGTNIADWAKMTTLTQRSPSGDFQVHFYQNRATGKTYFLDDFKVIFNHDGAWR